MVLGWGLLQGCIFPGLADLFFLPLAVARPEKAYRLAALATLGTLTGSVLLYWAGAESLAFFEEILVRYARIPLGDIASYRERLAAHGAWAVFFSTMSPLSTKLTSLASGAVGVPFPGFALAVLAGRLTRTMAFAWLVRHGGSQLVARFTRTPLSS